MNTFSEFGSISSKKTQVIDAESSCEYFRSAVRAQQRPYGNKEN